jgi:hypothetical protein
VKDVERHQQSLAHSIEFPKFTLPESTITNILARRRGKA